MLIFKKKYANLMHVYNNLKNSLFASILIYRCTSSLFVRIFFFLYLNFFLVILLLLLLLYTGIQTRRFLLRVIVAIMHFGVSSYAAWSMVRKCFLVFWFVRILMMLKDCSNAQMDQNKRTNSYKIK